MVQLHWYIAVLVSPDRRLYVLPKLWSLWVFRFREHSKFSLFAAKLHFVANIFKLLCASSKT